MKKDLIGTETKDSETILPEDWIIKNFSIPEKVIIPDINNEKIPEIP